MSAADRCDTNVSRREFRGASSPGRCRKASTGPRCPLPRAGHRLPARLLGVVDRLNGVLAFNAPTSRPAEAPAGRSETARTAPRSQRRAPSNARRSGARTATVAGPVRLQPRIDVNCSCSARGMVTPSRCARSRSANRRRPGSRVPGCSSMAARRSSRREPNRPSEKGPGSRASRNWPARGGAPSVS